MTDKDKEKGFSVINGNGEKKSEASVSATASDGKITFDGLAKAYGLSRAIAAGVRAAMNVKADGTVREADFVAALKKFTGAVPQ